MVKTLMRAKIATLILCLLLCVPIFAQNSTVQNWRVENEGFYGSFWWKVERTDYRQNDGFYYYYVYAQSNSYLNFQGNYVKATTYLEGVKVIMLDNIKSYQYELPFDYLLFDWERFYVAYFYHQSPNKKFAITYYNIYPYSYSKLGKY